MSIDAIGAIGTHTSTISGITPINTSINQAGASQSASFVDFLQAQVQQTDTSVKAAEHQAQLLATGEADSLHQVMIAMSKAKTEFELTVQMRNKLLEGFQEVMRMQI